MSGKKLSFECTTNKRQGGGGRPSPAKETVALSVLNFCSKQVVYVELWVSNGQERLVYQMPPTASPNEDYLEPGEMWQTSKTILNGLPTEYFLKAMSTDFEEWRCGQKNLDAFSELTIDLKFT